MKRIHLWSTPVVVSYALVALTPGSVQGQRSSTPDTTWRATAATAIPVTRRLEGDPSVGGQFRYYYQAPPGASLSAHRHSVDMHITVRRGTKFILMGPRLEDAKVQRFEAGSTFVIPANTWHVEWWETDTLEEIWGEGPMQSERASPATPRRP